MRKRTLLVMAVLLCGLSQLAFADISLTQIGTYASGIFARGAAEIVAHDSRTQRLFVVNAANATVDVLDISDPTTPSLLFTIDATSYGSVANSVAVARGVVAVAVESDPKTDPGKVVFFDTDGQFFSAVSVGALPDMVTFTPNGRKVLVANEGEPNDEYTIDPEGSVSIINLSRSARRVTQADVTTVDFTAFNNVPLDPSIRIFGPNATVAQDLEPEYITVSHEGKEAWVTLQEGNAIAHLDIERGVFTQLKGLGFKDHSLPGNGLDASDRDDGIRIANWPVKGMYLPDAIASYRFRGQTFLVTANEGDTRDYDGFSEEARVNDLALDPAAFPNAADLQQDSTLGRLTVTTTNGDTNRDGQFEELYVPGARSLSIWTASGELVFDSGDAFEQITASALPDNFNSDNEENNFDNRSDNKGPEPEGVVVGSIGRRTYAFVGLERISGIIVYEVTNPFQPTFAQYVNNRNFAGDPEQGTAGDLGPEGLLFIPRSKSPNKKPLLVVGNEISGTTTIFQIDHQRRN